MYTCIYIYIYTWSTHLYIYMETKHGIPPKQKGEADVVLQQKRVLGWELGQGSGHSMQMHRTNISWGFLAGAL